MISIIIIVVLSMIIIIPIDYYAVLNKFVKKIL